jgi:hypothetical protein
MLFFLVAFMSCSCQILHRDVRVASISHQRWEVQVSGPLADTIPLHDNDHVRRARVQALRPDNAPLRIQADAEQCATHGEDAIEDTMAFRNEVPAQKVKEGSFASWCREGRSGDCNSAVLAEYMLPSLLQLVGHTNCTFRSVQRARTCIEHLTVRANDFLHYSIGTAIRYLVIMILNMMIQSPPATTARR